MRIEIQNGFAALVDRPDMSIPPGPLYRPEVEQRLIQAARSNPTWNGIQVWGSNNLNEPSGDNVYRNLWYWLDSQLGRYVGLRMVAGFYNRWQGLGPFNAVDGEHFSRVANIVNALAPTDPFARLFQEELYEHLCARWYATTKGSNMLYWGVNDILQKYPAKQGSSDLNRSFAHALAFAVEYGARTGQDRLARDLMKVAIHCQDELSGSVYMIRPFNPAFPKIEDSAYEKKINTHAETYKDPGLHPAEIAAADSPAFYTAFEMHLITDAVALFIERFGTTPEYSKLYEGLKKTGPFAKEIIFPTHPELNHPKAVDWGHALLPFQILGDLDPIKEITKNPIGAGAGQAIHPSLYPA